MPASGHASSAVPLRSGRVQPLDDRRRAHAAAGAHGDQGDLLVGALELVEGGLDQHRAGAADRVTEGHRAAVDVERGRVEVELTDRLEHDGRERLVDLPDVDVVPGHAGLLQRPLGGRAGGGEHDHRLGPDGRRHADAGPRRQAVRPRVVGRRHEDRRRAIDDAGAVAGVVDVVDVVDLRVRAQAHLVERLATELVPRRGAHLLEARGELGELLQGRAGPRELLVVEGDRAVLVAHRDHALVEAALGDGDGGALLRHDGELVAVGAREALDGRDEVGRDALRDQRELLAHERVVAVHRRRHAVVTVAERAAHRLDATADHEVLVARQHARGGHADGLLAGTAEAVDRQAGRRRVPAGREHGEAGDVGTVVADAAGVAGDDVLDLRRRHAGARHDRAQALGEQLLRVDVVQRTVLLALAARGAHPVDDPGLALTHGQVTPSVGSRRRPSEHSEPPGTARSRIRLIARVPQRAALPFLR